MNQEHYKTYTTDDFLLDEEFIEIVRKEKYGQLKYLKDSLPEKHQEINLAIKILHELHSPEFHQDKIRKQELWIQIVRKQVKRSLFFYYRFAASVLFLIGIGSAAFYISNQEQTEKIIVKSELPSNNAILILADGSSVSIESIQSSIQYSKDGSSILLNDTSGITQAVPEKGFNQLIVPFGKRSFIILSEGTRVWLNSGSKLVFPPVFKGNTREVILEGEGYFEVAHNVQKPFYVKTDAFKIKVYGTKFNVQAYRQDQDQNVVLVDGKVSMNSTYNSTDTEVFLAPSQKASIKTGEDKFEISAVENTEVYTAWIDGYLTFTNEKVPELLKRVSRYYNVTIDAKLSDDIENIYGKLDLKDDLSRVLNGIAFISKTKYKQQDDKYVFYE